MTDWELPSALGLQYEEPITSLSIMTAQSHSELLSRPSRSPATGQFSFLRDAQNATNGTGMTTHSGSC
jgi:hypothetical protein